MRKHLYAGVRPLCLYWLNNSIGSFSVYIAFIMYCHSIRGQHTPTPTTCRTRVSSHTERSLRLKRPQLQDNPPSLRRLFFMEARVLSHTPLLLLKWGVVLHLLLLWCRTFTYYALACVVVVCYFLRYDALFD